MIECTTKTISFVIHFKLGHVLSNNNEFEKILSESDTEMIVANGCSHIILDIFSIAIILDIFSITFCTAI